MSTILEEESMMTEARSCMQSQKTLALALSTRQLAAKIFAERGHLDEKDFEISSPSSNIVPE